MTHVKNVLKEMFSLSFKGRKVTIGESIYRVTILVILLLIAKTKYYPQSELRELLQTIAVCFTGIFIAEMTFPTFRKALIRIKQRRG